MSDIDHDENQTIEEGDNKPKWKKKETIFKSYGEDWDGEFTKVAEMADLIPSFKAFYFGEKRADPKKSVLLIVKEFNKKIFPLRLYPYPTQYQSWRKKWDKQLLLEMGMVEQRITEAKRVRDVVNVRDAERGVTLVPSESELEGGIKTLGGMLVNDAVEMLQDDKELEEIYDSDELIKRKNYVLNVFAHVTRHVQGKEALAIKKHAEGRETAGFLMNLLNSAKAGRMGTDDLTVLENSITVEPLTTAESQ